MKDCTVINLASVGPGARAAQMLADLGADVIQVGAVTRAGSVQIEPEYYAYGAGRGVRRVRLDLKSDGGLDAFLSLVASADVLIESFRPGVVSKLGIGYNDLRTRNAGLVYCSVSGYGQTGPYSQWAGHDINYLALGGFLDCSGRDQRGVPAIPGATIADSAGGGMQAVIGILAALLRRQHSGSGEYLDVAVADGVLSTMSLHIDKYLAKGVEVKHGSDLLTGRYAWYGCYRTADDRFVSIGAIEPKFYRNLCALLGLEQYSDRQYDDEIQAQLRDDMHAVLLTDSRDNWVAKLAPNDTCVAPVLSISELVDDRHLHARQAFQPVVASDLYQFRQLAPVIAGCPRPGGANVSIGHFHTEAVLREAGVSEGRIRLLLEQGAAE